jgi:multidrug resistance protein
MTEVSSPTALLDDSAATPRAVGGAPTPLPDTPVGQQADASSKKALLSRGDSVSAPAAVSIYDLRSRREKWYILLAAAVIALLTPATDTIYLPALVQIAGSLPGASNPDLLLLSVSLYMVMVGVTTLLWGPLSDRFGRRVVLLVTLVLFIAVTIGCIFARDIGALIGLRAVQGAVVGSTVSVTQAIIADLFAPPERGYAMGVWTIPLLVGPIAAPAIGGAITQAWDWRATFTLLAGLGALLTALAAAVPETHQWMTLQRRQRAYDAACKDHHQQHGGGAAVTAPPPPLPPVAEAAEIHPPEMLAPWVPLTFLVEPALSPVVAVGAASFATMFVSLTTFPSVLAQPPYSLSEGIIGVCYLPIGVALMAGSHWGGAASDAAGARRPGVPSARLIPNLLGALALPAGALVYGLCFHYGVNLAGPLVGHLGIGFGAACFGPAQMAYISSLKQRQAAAAAAGMLALNFSMAGLLISVAVPLEQALGLAGLFGLLAGVNVAIIAWAGVVVALDVRRHARRTSVTSSSIKDVGAASDVEAVAAAAVASTPAAVEPAGGGAAV